MSSLNKWTGVDSFEREIRRLFCFVTYLQLFEFFYAGCERKRLHSMKFGSENSKKIYKKKNYFVTYFRIVISNWLLPLSDGSFLKTRFWLQLPSRGWNLYALIFRTHFVISCCSRKIQGFHSPLTSFNQYFEARKRFLFFSKTLERLNLIYGVNFSPHLWNINLSRASLAFLKFKKIFWIHLDIILSVVLWFQSNVITLYAKFELLSCV